MSRITRGESPTCDEVSGGGVARWRSSPHVRMRPETNDHCGRDVILFPGPPVGVTILGTRLDYISNRNA
jgi:hypothetical protein